MKLSLKRPSAYQAAHLPLPADVGELYDEEKKGFYTLQAKQKQLSRSPAKQILWQIQGSYFICRAVHTWVISSIMLNATFKQGRIVYLYVLYIN